MKRFLISMLSVLLIVNAFLPAVCAYKMDGLEPTVNRSGSPITSADEKYQYWLDKETKEASFVESFEKDVTVLEIPAEIDGYPVTSVSGNKCASNAVVGIKFSDSIECIGQDGLEASEKDVPTCFVDMNEGLISISGKATYNGYFPLSCKVLIFPRSLKYIGWNSIQRGSCENIVFQSNPETNANSITVDDGPYAYFKNADPQQKINYYFTGDATNLSEFTFNYQPFNWEHDLESSWTFPTRGVTIYKKPGAQGFEKFLNSSHEEYISDYTSNWEIPEYTVKEYTEEWWHDLAEIETVTMTAEGMTEITKNKGKGLSDAAKKYLSHEYEKSVKSGEAFTVSSAFAPADAYDNRTFFVSMNEDIATVDIETGEVKALKKGTARIRCVAASGVFADCILTVDGGDGTNGVAPTEAEVEANDTTSSETQTTETTSAPTATQSQTQPNKALSFLADKKFYIIPAAVILTAAVAAVCIVRKKKR